MKYIAKFSGFAIAVSVLLFSACSNPTQNQEATMASEEVNDTNTPLHLMQPDYDTPYGIPQTADVKEVMDRVLGYISEGMPAQYDDSLRLVRGRFRLTSYECGVAYSAALAAYKATGDEAYLRFVTDRANVLAELAPKVADKLAADPKFDSEMRRVLRPAALDDCGAMAASFIRLQMEGQKSEAYDPLIARYMDFIVNKEYRLPDGTYARNRPHHNTVWLDDMYMAIPALAWYGSYTGDARYTNEAVRQLHLFKDKMWVPEVQLFRHGWVEGMTPHPNFHWGRCNGWAILTMCEVLDNLPANHKERPFVLDLLRQHIEGLCRLQHQTGLWHQLLDLRLLHCPCHQRRLGRSAGLWCTGAAGMECRDDVRQRARPGREVLRGHRYGLRSRLLCLSPRPCDGIPRLWSNPLGWCRGDSYAPDHMAQNERFGRALLSKGAEDQRAHLQRGCVRW